MGAGADGDISCNGTIFPDHGAFVPDMDSRSNKSPFPDGTAFFTQVTHIQTCIIVFPPEDLPFFFVIKVKKIGEQLYKKFIHNKSFFHFDVR